MSIERMVLAFASSFILISLIKDDMLREMKLWWGNSWRRESLLTSTASRKGASCRLA